MAFLFECNRHRAEGMGHRVIYHFPLEAKVYQGGLGFMSGDKDLRFMVGNLILLDRVG